MSGRGRTVIFWVARVLIVAVTVVASWLVMTVGTVEEPLSVAVNMVSPETLTVPAGGEAISVVDEAATEQARRLAELQVPTEKRRDPLAEEAVLKDIDGFFRIVASNAQPIVDEAGPSDELLGETTTTTTTAPTTTTTAPEEGESTTTTATTAPPATTTTTTPIVVTPVEDQLEALKAGYPQLSVTTIETFVQLANEDVDLGRDPSYLSEVADEARAVAERELGDQIEADRVSSVKERILENPPFIRLPLDLDLERQGDIRAAVAEVVAEFLQPNFSIDEAETEAQRQAARDAVEPIEVTFEPGQNITVAGEVVTAVQFAALVEAGLLSPNPELISSLPPLALITILMAVVSLYLVRFRPGFWANQRRLVLLGFLVVLAAASARLVEILIETQQSVTVGYLMPAALFGFLAAILFDARIGVLLAVVVGTLAGLATGDMGLTLFTISAVVVPLPFVSSISTRTDYRRAVLFTALAMAPLAGAIAWTFQGSEEVALAAVLAFANGLATGFIAQGLLPVFETVFDITTTLTLLDLTDRNHPALRLLEERALGTFNHSLMVGNLAETAARAIGANPLLARAAGYYHDLGKTENPQFFIENQFGVSNPHDHMPPDESAAVIRQHVEDGKRLAETFRLPTAVADAVVSHHGTGIMRYFFYKAKERAGGAEIDERPYRHHGREPRTKEMTILMLADAVEGATRSLVQNEDPTAESIRSLVDDVVAEKVEDGQLDMSPLTFGDLKRVKEALAEALIGFYHQRIPYPGFPQTSELRPPVAPVEGTGGARRLGVRAADRLRSSVEGARAEGERST